MEFGPAVGVGQVRGGDVGVRRVEGGEGYQALAVGIVDVAQVVQAQAVDEEAAGYKLDLERCTMKHGRRGAVAPIVYWAIDHDLLGYNDPFDS